MPGNLFTQYIMLALIMVQVRRIWKNWTVDGGYVCGNKILIAGFVASNKMHYSYIVESQWYSPKTGTKEGRVFLRTIAACVSASMALSRRMNYSKTGHQG